MKVVVQLGLVDPLCEAARLGKCGPGRLKLSSDKARQVYEYIAIETSSLPSSEHCTAEVLHPVVAAKIPVMYACRVSD